MIDSAATVFVVLVSCGALSATLTALSIRYARGRQLLDLPGRRRSHTMPTPRGGGIGIVVTVFIAVLLFWSSHPEALELAAAVAIVGAAGWIDDHRGLAARWRLLAHVLAVALLLVPLALGVKAQLCAFPIEMSCAQIGWLVAALLSVAGLLLVWSINLHNFMDGIDGILALQASFVFAVASVAFAHAGDARDAITAAACLACTLGFLPFNFPRARVFMGDVGSGVLGLLIGVVAILLAVRPGIAKATGLIACSAFVTDATCTLLSRMLRGRRWYSAHREHLYQWLVRAGLSHAKVVALYMGWNLLIALPVALWMNWTTQITMRSEIVFAISVYGLAIATWWLGKRWCLSRVAKGGRHASA